MNAKPRPKPLWVVVEVFRGLPARVAVFRKRAAAEKREAAWRRGMNFEYDDTGVFRAVPK